MPVKSLPIGIEDFAKIKGKYYVDKTLIIKDLIDNCVGQSVLLTRPRRFGKSLTLSMLEYYFSLKLDARDLFADKKIMQCGKEYLAYMNNYPVVRINMKNVSQPTYQEMVNTAIKQIGQIFRTYAEVKTDNLFAYEKQKYDDIANVRLKDPLDYTDSIAFLTELIYKKYQKKTVILIDEYDTPLENAQEYGFYQEAIEFFKRFYSATLKANEFAELAFVTGVLQISEESIFSELNNLAVYGPIDQAFNEYFGFNEKEVIDSLELFNINVDISLLREYYSGYGYQGNIYNPWSILNYLLNERIDDYWSNTGSNKMVNKIIGEIPDAIYTLNEFVNNQSKAFVYNRAITYVDVKNDYETLFSYLVQTGYLVARPINNTNKCLLYIPNNEIKSIFETEIIARNKNKKANDAAKTLKAALLEGKEEEISYCLKNYVFDQYSYYDKLENEKDFQMIINGILGILFNDYLVRPEVNNRYGRCDIMLSPKSGQGTGIIIEIKKYKNRVSKVRFEKYAEDAIKQIKEKEYYNELQRMGTKPILLYAFIFSDFGNYVKMEPIK